MTKFDHRLKRLELRTGIKKDFEYFVISNEEQIQDIKLDPEKKNMFIISAIPRPDRKALKERHASPPMVETLDPSELTDEDLDKEIIRIQKELDNVKVKTKPR